MQDPARKIARLPAAARYTPWLRHTDPLAAGLYRFGHDLGNRVLDQQLFQFDNEFPRYRANLVANRAERLDKYYARENLSTPLARAVNRLLLAELLGEHPELFRMQVAMEGPAVSCALTGEQLRFSAAGELLGADSHVAPGYVDGLDALAAQVQEDIAVLQRDAQHHYRVRALHLCCPNHWGADTRIGEDFTALHGPVPGFNARHPHGEQLLDAVAQRGPYLRFVWGLASDTRLNHHPEPAAGVDPAAWQGRALEQANTLSVRIERQVLRAIPGSGAVLFTIRTLFTDTDTLPREARLALAEQLLRMAEGLLRYKGIRDAAQLAQRLCAG